ncbi:hypothetical protein LEMLEM_LOCUS24924 [Lemmus lemmus]
MFAYIYYSIVKDVPETWRKSLHDNACQAEFSEGQLDPAPHHSTSFSSE